MFYCRKVSKDDSRPQACVVHYKNKPLGLLVGLWVQAPKVGRHLRPEEVDDGTLLGASL